MEEYCFTVNWVTGTCYWRDSMICVRLQCYDLETLVTRPLSQDLGDKVFSVWVSRPC